MTPDGGRCGGKDTTSSTELAMMMNRPVKGTLFYSGIRIVSRQTNRCVFWRDGPRHIVYMVETDVSNRYSNLFSHAGFHAHLAWPNTLYLT